MRLNDCSALKTQSASSCHRLTWFAPYSLNQEASLGQCFSFLNLAFENAEPLDIDLSSFSLRFRELQAIEQPYEDIDAVRRICLSLEADLCYFLKRQAIVKRVEENFALSKKLLSSISIAEAKGAIPPNKKASYNAGF